GRRHGGGRHHGDSDSSSEEEGGRRERRVARMRDYVDNMRSFDGQEVVDMHVFQLHNLEGLSAENIKKLTDLVSQEKKDHEDFMP
ncbi:hypothetical protein, partial [Salmonella sp. s51884]|uniref:hypothetical protein n=1 Tax=Salmonella sp. s51884 TaxID=3159654 RepID=UPI00397EB6CD